MGHKTHPYGFRLGIIKDWKAHWYAPNSSSYRDLVIQDLRRQTEAVFGDRFDIRQFHDRVIEDGTVTLSMLEAKIGAWIEAER